MMLQFTRSKLTFGILLFLPILNLLIGTSPINAQQRCIIDVLGESVCETSQEPKNKQPSEPDSLSDSFTVDYPEQNISFDLKIQKCFMPEIMKLKCRISVVKTKGEDLKGQLRFYQGPSGVRFYGDGTMSVNHGHAPAVVYDNGLQVETYHQNTDIQYGFRDGYSDVQIIKNNQPFHVDVTSNTGRNKVKAIKKLTLPFLYSMGGNQTAYFGNINISENGWQPQRRFLFWTY
jgi:hypothetical protein